MEKRIYLFLILALALIVRLYYFFLTQDQPLWWDEAEYALKAKSIALGTPETGFWDGRPILFPLLLSAFYALGLGEVAIRFFLVLVSVASVILVYAIGARMFSAKIGLIAAFLYSLEYLNLSYSMRIMTDVPHVTIGLLAIYIFLGRNPRHIWSILPILAVGTLFRFTTFLFVVVLIVYLAFVEGSSFLKRRGYQLSAGLALLVVSPYLVWSQWKFQNPLHAIWVGGGHMTPGRTSGFGLGVLKEYVVSLPPHLHAVLLALFLLEALFLYDVLCGFDAVVEGRDRPAAHRFFLLVWILVTLLFYGFGVSHHEYRYVLMAYPAVFILVALAIERMQTAIAQGQKYQQSLPAVFLVAVLAIGGFQLWRDADTEIRSKRVSFEPVKQAGAWIAENSSPADKVMTMSVPQTTYYSGRESYPMPESEAAFVSALESLKPKYIVMSAFEKHPEWTYEVDSEKYGMRPVKRIPEEDALLVVYETDR